jgi:hypothetical protein
MTSKHRQLFHESKVPDSQQLSGRLGKEKILPNSKITENLKTAYAVYLRPCSSSPKLLDNILAVLADLKIYQM